MDVTEQRERLAKSQAQWRRISAGVWSLLALFIVLICGIGWWMTREDDWLYGMLFYGSVPIWGLLHTHFVVLNPWRDPLKTQERLPKRVEMYREHRINVPRIARTSGWILVVAWPLSCLFAIGMAADEHGLLGVLWGLIVMAVWLIASIWLIRWGRSARTRWWRG